MTAPTSTGFRPGRGLIIGGSIAAALLLLLIVVVSTVSGYRSTLIEKENALTAEYSSAQNNLSTYISTIHEAIGVADRNTAALDEVLTDAIRGRYDGESSAQPGTGQMFNAIVEAYPDLAGMSDRYAAVQTAIFAGRESFKNEQDHLLDMIRDYNTYREVGLFRSTMIGMFLDAPGDRLTAAIGDDKVYGQAALDRMSDIITTPQGDQAYRDGSMEPLDLGPTTAPDADGTN